MDSLDIVDPELGPLFDFLLYASRLSGVVRGTRIADGSRSENVAEHSWHLALAAVLLVDWGPSDVCLLRVLKMLIIHDLVEIEVGDTPYFGSEPKAAQAARERDAAVAVFGQLPVRIGSELCELWHEFEQGSSSEARFAKALDRLQPQLMNYSVKGGTWSAFAISRLQEEPVVEAIRRGSPRLAEGANRLLDAAVARGYLRSSTGH